MQALPSRTSGLRSACPLSSAPSIRHSEFLRWHYPSCCSYWPAGNRSWSAVRSAKSSSIKKTLKIIWQSNSSYFRLNPYSDHQDIIGLFHVPLPFFNKLIQEGSLLLHAFILDRKQHI